MIHLSGHIDEPPHRRAAFAAHQARTRASRWGEITAGISRHYTIREEPA